jgi:hypothetical protein
MKRLLVVLAALLLAGDIHAQSAAAAPTASLRITQRALVAMCMNDVPVESSKRRWTIGPQEVRLTVTMRNEPRHAHEVAGPAGRAAIAFRPEPGHRYEIEVRADSQSFARRVWTARNWTPVVRDRTTEQIVSTPPDWSPAACLPTR